MVDLEAEMEKLLDNGVRREKALRILKRKYGFYSKEDNPLARE